MVSPHRVLSPESNSLMRSAGRRVEYARHKVLFREGDDSTSVLLIESGQVKVTSVSSTGYVFQLAQRGPGELVGEFGAAGEAPRAATVTTITVVTGYSVTAPRFRELLQQPGVALELVQLVSARVREADRNRLELAADPAFRRIVRVLLDQSTRQGGTTIAILHQDLASAAGTSLESVNRAIRELRHQGGITTQTGRIVIADMDLLSRQMEI